jgi:hypothetical protein
MCHHHHQHTSGDIKIVMSPLLGHRPSLWITHKENRPYPTTRAQCGLVGANDCKRQLGPAASHAFRSTEEFEIKNFGHPSNDERSLNFANACRSALTAGPSKYLTHYYYSH